MPTFNQHTKIDAPVDKVWAILTNPATWEQWFPDVDRLTNLSAVAADTTFEWQHGSETGSGTIVEVDNDRGLIKVVISHEGKQTTHTFDLDRAGGFFGLGGNDTRIEYKREYDAPGGFIGEFVTGGNPADALKVKHTLEKVKNLAEG
jgi:carbon monoxide dehydrogenase subunit G